MKFISKETRNMNTIEGATEDFIKYVSEQDPDVILVVCYMKKKIYNKIAIVKETISYICGRNASTEEKNILCLRGMSEKGPRQHVHRAP